MVRTVGRLVIVGAVIAASGVFALSGPSTAGRVRATFTANDDNDWDPDFSHMTPDHRAVWKNPSGSTTDHDVKSYKGDWLPKVVLEPGERVGKTIKKEGVYRFRCVIHSQIQDGKCAGMCGILHVMKG